MKEGELDQRSRLQGRMRAPPPPHKQRLSLGLSPGGMPRLQQSLRSLSIATYHAPTFAMKYSFLSRALLLFLVLSTSANLPPIANGQPVATAEVQQTITRQLTTDDIVNVPTATLKIAEPKDEVKNMAPTLKFTEADFRAYSAPGAKVTLIVAVKDYGVRGFPVLAAKLWDLQQKNPGGEFSQIIFVHVGAPENVQYDMLSIFANKPAAQFEFMGPETTSMATKLSAAFNKAAKKATGDYLLFLTDLLEDVSANAISEMARLLQHPKIGIVGPKLIDGSKGNRVVWSAGLDLLNGKNPHRPSWTSWSDPSTPFSAHTDVPFLLHRFQGHSVSDSRVSSPQEVFGVSKHCLMIKTSHFRDVGGFVTHFDASYLDLDLALRVKYSTGKVALYAPMVQISVTGQDTTGDDSLNGDFQQLESVKNDNKAFLERWLDDIHPILKKQLKLTGLTVVWSMDCGTGQVLGFTTEAVNLIMELQKVVRVKVVNDQTSCRSELARAGFPDVTIKTIDILSKRDDKDVSGTEQLVVIMHKDPRRYDSGYAYNPPELLIGRSMYETDSIPADWKDALNSVDFIWVPSEFNRQTFTNAGVNASKLDILPETIDLLHFDPDVTHVTTAASLSAGPEVLESPAQFNFLSVFKWEPRKAWDTLLQAYFDEFSNCSDTTKVHLYIRSNVDAENVNAFESWIKRYLATTGLTASQLPKVTLMHRFVPYSKLPTLYKAAQAFVTPTRGEGWGLPIMEAMSMGLPVITTQWSGLTEFTTADTVYYLKYKLVDGPQTGHKWAQADLPDLRRALRQVYSQPDKAAQVGKAARVHLLDKFQPEAAALQVVDKIRAQIPNFSTLKQKRPVFNFNHYGSYYNSPPSFQSGFGNFGNPPPSTSTITNSWGGNTASTNIEKYGQTLVKTKFTE